MIAKQTLRLIAHLARGGKVNSTNCYRDIGVLRLAARVFDANAAGFKVSKKKVQLINAYNEKVNVTDYYFTPKVQQEAKTFLKNLNK